MAEQQSTEEQSTDDLSQRIDKIMKDMKAGIEGLVGAPKEYAKMSQQELWEEHIRLSNQDFPGYHGILAKDKLSEAFLDRGRRDRQQLGDKLASEPVPEKFVRVYRGEDKDGLGQYFTTEPVAGKSGKWFTTNLDKASAFAGNKRDQGRVRYMDIPQSDFKALLDMTKSNEEDIQVPIGYDTQAGSKVLMSDGSIPPEITKDNRKESLLIRPKRKLDF